MSINISKSRQNVNQNKCIIMFIRKTLHAYRCFSTQTQSISLNLQPQKVKQIKFKTSCKQDSKVRRFIICVFLIYLLYIIHLFHGSKVDMKMYSLEENHIPNIINCILQQNMKAENSFRRGKTSPIQDNNIHIMMSSKLFSGVFFQTIDSYRKM